MKIDEDWCFFEFWDDKMVKVVPSRPLFLPCELMVIVVDG